MKLSEFFKEYPEYEKIYRVLQRFLPPPEEIQIYSFADAEKHGLGPIKPTAMGFTYRPQNAMYFRIFPPYKIDFAHELIHICKKPEVDLPEEVFAYNLAPLVLLCAEWDMYDLNIFKLFLLSENDIIKILRKHGLNSIEDFYLYVGFIPPTHEFTGYIITRRPGFREIDIVVTFITTLIDEAEYYETARKILQDLLLTYCQE